MKRALGFPRKLCEGNESGAVWVPILGECQLSSVCLFTLGGALRCLAFFAALVRGLVAHKRVETGQKHCRIESVNVLKPFDRRYTEGSYWRDAISLDKQFLIRGKSDKFD